MHHLGVVFEGLEVGEAPPLKSAQSEARLTRAEAAWARGPWRAYALGRGPERKLVFTVSVPDQDGAAFETAEVTLVTDASLFLQLAEVAVSLGATGMTKALSVLSETQEIIPFTRRLLVETHAQVERWLAEELSRTELLATAFARAELKALRTANQTARDRFVSREFLGVSARVLNLSDADKRSLFSKLVEARSHRLRLEGLAAELRSRDRKDGSTPQRRAAARSRDQYRALLYEIYAGPYRTEMTALGRLQDEIRAIFAPALAILSEVDADLAGWTPVAEAAPLDKKRMAELEVKYDDLLWAALETHSDVLNGVGRTLAARSVPGWADDYFDLPLKARVEAGSLIGHLTTRLTAKAPGAAAAMEEMAGTGPLPLWGLARFLARRDAYLDENHVLARIPLLIRMATAAGEDASSALDAALLQTFLRDLERRERALIAEEKAGERAWHVLEVGLALCGLVVGVGSLVLGPGEILVPASLGVLATLLGAALMAGTILMLSRAILSALTDGLRSKPELQARLLDLGLKTPEGLEELGRFVQARRALMLNLAQTVVEELIELAAQRLLPPLAFALDMRDHMDAMDVLAVEVFGDAPEPAA